VVKLVLGASYIGIYIKKCEIKNISDYLTV